jgi:hypothetical protein
MKRHTVFVYTEMCRSVTVIQLDKRSQAELPRSASIGALPDITDGTRD